MIGHFALAQDTREVRIENFNLQKQVALQGYDPVSYLDGDPTKGSEEFSVQHGGVTYHFSNLSNLEAFKKDPEKYEPQYGGWCAYAMGVDGSKVKVDPETYKILDGELYLFYNFGLTNTLTKWNKKESDLKDAADTHWRGHIE